MTEPEPAPFPHPALQRQLQTLATEHGELSIARLFQQDPDRVEDFSAEAAGWRLDYSRQLLNRDARRALLELAQAAAIKDAREALFDGQAVNLTEERAALHTLLRATDSEDHLQSKLEEVKDCRYEMAEWVDRVHSGKHRGYSGETITDVVNLGIGGSDLGPRMVVQALRPFHNNSLRTHFCANIDPAELATVLKDLNPARTLFIVCSKTLRTEETLHNANSARRWLLASGAPENAVAAHFLAASTNIKEAREFGIPAQNILPLWDWVGGRYSLWSAIGWSIAFAVGNKHFTELLAGAEAMDRHFRTTPPDSNLAVIMSLLEVWNVNFLEAQSCAVIPYQHNLALLPAFLQQLSMESNGKRVNRDGIPLDYATAPVLWGAEGTNGQHSFHQLLHQGSVLCPVDFILPLTSPMVEDQEGHQRLVANCLSQARALLIGRDENAALDSLLARGLSRARARQLAPHLVVPGNRPSSTLSCSQLTPGSLGALLALYEHKTFCSGLFWQINSFDQWGVELGKELGTEIYASMKESSSQAFDPSTNALLERWRHEQ
jgi:glucose-6-phosphate isomerase